MQLALRDSRSEIAVVDLSIRWIVSIAAVHPAILSTVCAADATSAMKNKNIIAHILYKHFCPFRKICNLFRF